MLKHSLPKIAPPVPLLRVLVVLGIVAGTLIWLTSQRHDQRADIRQSEFSSQSKGRVFYPTAEQWATLTVEPVQQRVFQSEHVTEGKIAVESKGTPAEIIDTLNQGTNAALTDPKIKARLADLGGTALPGTPADFRPPGQSAFMPVNFTSLPQLRVGFEDLIV